LFYPTLPGPITNHNKALRFLLCGQTIRPTCLICRMEFICTIRIEKKCFGRI